MARKKSRSRKHSKEKALKASSTPKQEVASSAKRKPQRQTPQSSSRRLRGVTIPRILHGLTTSLFLYPSSIMAVETFLLWIAPHWITVLCEFGLTIFVFAVGVHMAVKEEVTDPKERAGCLVLDLVFVLLPGMATPVLELVLTATFWIWPFRFAAIALFVWLIIILLLES